MACAEAMSDAEGQAAAATDRAEGGEEEQPRIVLPPSDEPPLDPTYLQLFLLKYVHVRVCARVRTARLLWHAGAAAACWRQKWWRL